MIAVRAVGHEWTCNSCVRAKAVIEIRLEREGGAAVFGLCGPCAHALRMQLNDQRLLASPYRGESTREVMKKHGL